MVTNKLNGSAIYYSLVLAYLRHVIIHCFWDGQMFNWPNSRYKKLALEIMMLFTVD